MDSSTATLYGRPQTIEQLRLVLDITSTAPPFEVTAEPAPGFEHAGIRRGPSPEERAAKKRRRAIAEASRRRNRGR